MNVIIATGGLDEMAIDISYAILAVIFFFIAGLLALTWWKRSLIALVIVSIFVLLDGLLIQPWSFVVTQPSDGPYDQTWQFNMQIISVIWVFTVALACACLVRVLRHRKGQRLS